MTIDYDHRKNLHTLQGPRCALPILFPDGMPRSILDVGCGTGTWLRAALDLGAIDVVGIDGVEVPGETLLIDSRHLLIRDLTGSLDLGRRFDVVFCLEVAEHLDESSSAVLINNLTQHADHVVFSAASPGQPGQHHVNCQWPAYWQRLFNERGYVCEDEVRWKLWDLAEIEPWYKQNIFLANYSPLLAGREPRIRSILHPEMVEVQLRVLRLEVETIEQGGLAMKRYPALLARAVWAKLKRRLSAE